MLSIIPMPPRVACVNVAGVLGPSCHAVSIDGALYGVADAADGEVGVADRWLAGLAGSLGRRPRGERLADLLQPISRPAGLPGNTRPVVTGAAVALAEHAGLTIGRLGSACAYRVRDHRPVLIAREGSGGAVVIRVRPWPGDRFLLATDGFRELLDDQTLTELTWGEPTHTCTRLHELALDRLAQDAAAVVLAFGEYR